MQRRRRNVNYQALKEFSVGERKIIFLRVCGYKNCKIRFWIIVHTVDRCIYRAYRIREELLRMET